MFSDLKKFLRISLMAAVVGLTPVICLADYHPTHDGGDFGLGLELGDPGSWGVDGKLWIDRVNAFQPAVKFNDGGNAILQLDYLWHNFDIVHIKNGNGQLPFYIGVGGDLLLQSNSLFGVRMPLGLSYIFNKKNVPVDIYFQVVPTLWFYDNGTTLDWYPEFGAHIYL
jgi:hypothetical protein